MNLSSDFISNILSTFGNDGKKFLDSLPELIQETSAMWELSEVHPVSNLSFNFVATARRGDEDVILKLGVLNKELVSEIAALKFYSGNGACRLLESDEERGFLLLERLKPGRMLSELENDDDRTHIAIDVMEKIMESASSLANLQEHTHSGHLAPALQNFIKLSDWFDTLKRIRSHFDGSTGPFPKEILEQVESFLPQAFAKEEVKLLHGDFHHLNILSSDRGWLIIDPKGVIGPVGYEIGPFMINPWNSISDESGFKVQSKRRVDIIHERLGWERDHIIQWAMAHSVLSAWWDIEDTENEKSWNYALWCAQIFFGFK